MLNILLSRADMMQGEGKGMRSKIDEWLSSGAGSHRIVTTGDLSTASGMNVSWVEGRKELSVFYTLCCTPSIIARLGSHC